MLLRTSKERLKLPTWISPTLANQNKRSVVSWFSFTSCLRIPSWSLIDYPNEYTGFTRPEHDSAVRQDVCACRFIGKRKEHDRVAAAAHVWPRGQTVIISGLPMYLCNHNHSLLIIPRMLTASKLMASRWVNTTSRACVIAPAWSRKRPVCFQATCKAHLYLVHFDHHAWLIVQF